MISKTKMALMGAALLLAGAGFGAGAQAASSQNGAVLGAATDLSSQASTTRVPRARPRKMRSQRTMKKRTPRSTMPRSTNQ